MIDKILITRGFVKKIDPRVKVITAFIYSFVVAVETNFLSLLYLTVLPAFFIFSIKDKKKLFKRLIPVNFFLLFLWLIIPFTYPGDKFQMWVFNLSYQGLKYCLLISLKANLIVLTTAILLSTSPFLHIIHSLHHLKIPEKLVDILYFFSRYIPVINDEKEKLKRTMKARNFIPETSIHTYKTISNLVGMIILNSYERSEKVYRAMVARSFSGVFWTKNHFKWRKRDTETGIVITLYFLFCLILKWKKF